MPHSVDLLLDPLGYKAHRCVHCRKPLPSFLYHCSHCGGTVVEEVPDEAFTVELRVIHNPTGEMLSYKEDFYSREMGFSRVRLDRMLKSLMQKLKKLQEVYPEPWNEEDLPRPVSQEAKPIEKVRAQIQDIRQRILDHRSKTPRVTPETMPTSGDAIRYAGRVKEVIVAQQGGDNMGEECGGPIARFMENYKGI